MIFNFIFLQIVFLLHSVSSSHFFFTFSIYFHWLILKHLVTIFVFFVNFFGMLLLSMRTLFSYFLQCYIGFLLHCTFLHKFSLLKLLGTSGQDSYPISMTLDILIWLFLQKIRTHFVRFTSLSVLTAFIWTFSLFCSHSASLLNVHSSLSGLSFVCVSVRDRV